MVDETKPVCLLKVLSINSLRRSICFFWYSESILKYDILVVLFSDFEIKTIKILKSLMYVRQRNYS